MDFFKTPAGRKLIDRDIPKISVALERIAASLGGLLALAHNELGENNEEQKTSDDTRTVDSDPGPPWSST